MTYSMTLRFMLLLISHRMNSYLNLADTALVYIHHLEGIVLVIYLLMDAREVTLNLQEQSCQCIGITLYLSKLLVIHIQDATKVRKQSLALEDKVL